MDLQFRKYFNTISPFPEQMSRNMRVQTMWYVRPAKDQISLRIRSRSLIRAFARRLNIL